MKRHRYFRHFSLWCTAILAAFIVCFAPNVLHAAEPRVNVVFILADDQAWNGTSVPMIPGEASSRSRIFKTPNLEQLAAQGIVFSQAYAAHPKCEASRAAMQMGRTTTSLNAAVFSVISICMGSDGAEALARTVCVYGKKPTILTCAVCSPTGRPATMKKPSESVRTPLPVCFTDTEAYSTGAPWWVTRPLMVPPWAFAMPKPIKMKTMVCISLFM
jgi:hypothetical protein